MIAFVIIGLVMVILVGIMLSVTSQKKLAPIQKSFSEVTDVLRTESVRNYVEQCIQKTAIDGLHRITQKGGSLQPAAFLQFGDFQPQYWITARGDQENDDEYPAKHAYIHRFSSENKPAEYRLMDIPNAPDERGEKRFPFGDVDIPALCQTGGPNDPSKIGTIVRPCPAGFYSDTQSIQSVLDQYITTNAKNCIEADKIRDLGGFSEVTFRVETPDIKVTLGEEDVSIDAIYPVIVGVEKASREILTYHVAVPARLKRIYGLAQDLVRRDRTELSFDLAQKTHQQRSMYYDPSQEQLITINVQCPKCTEGLYDDAISILDKGSSLAGAPLLFTVARKNRRPVLQYIHEFDPAPENAEQGKDETFRDGTVKPFDLLFAFDVENPEDNFLEFEITAYDPDEDGIHFATIDGDDWKERLKRDCWGEYEVEENERVRKVPVDLPTLTLEKFREIREKILENGPRIENYADAEKLVGCRDGDVEEVTSEWEIAPKEKQPGEEHAFHAIIRKKDKPLQPVDFGYHDIVVKVCDENDGRSGQDANALCDNQTVTILVVDTLEEER